jgi:hypothetical protein
VIIPLYIGFSEFNIGFFTKTYAGGMGCLLHIFTFISEAMCRIVSRLAGGFFVLIGFLTVVPLKMDKNNGDF